MDKKTVRWMGIVCAGLLTLGGCGAADTGRTPGGGSGGGSGGGGTVPGCVPGCGWGFLCQGSSCVLDPTGKWIVRIASGTVSMRNASGSYWDADFSAPDPKVCLTINGSRSCTRTIQDSYAPVWNTDFQAATATALQAGVNIEYIDTDLASDDPICSGMLSVKSSDFLSGTWGFRCTSGLGEVSAQLIPQ